MNIKEISSKKLFKEYEIVVPYKDVDNSINQKINEIIPTVTLPGFRKGKAPLNIVKKKYENNILSEIIEKIIEENTKNLLKEKKLKVFRQPKVEIKKYEKNEPLEISIKLDIDPEITISPFEEILITKRTIELGKKDIEKNYKQFLDSQRHYHKINEKRPIKKSDKVVLNIFSQDEKVPDFLKSQSNVSVITDSDYQILPDLSYRLIEKKLTIGDKIKLKFDLKDILKRKNKIEAEFLIEILSIEHVHDFNITQEFLEKNNLKDEEDLQDNIKSNMLKQYEDLLIQIQKKELMDIMDKNNVFDVPEGLLEEEFNVIWEKLSNAKKENKLDDDDKKLSEKKLKERYEKIALRRVKLAILLQHIANDNKIVVSEKELTDGMMQYASQYPGQQKEIFEYFKKNPSSIETIRGPIFEQKIVDFILSKAKIKNEKININKFEKLQENAYKNKEI